MRFMRWNRRAQVTAEMAVLFTFVIAAFIFMGFYLQRATQGAVKGNADGLGQQFSTIGGWNSSVKSTSKTAGKVTTSTSDTTYDHTVK